MPLQYGALTFKFTLYSLAINIVTVFAISFNKMGYNVIGDMSRHLSVFKLFS